LPPPSTTQTYTLSLHDALPISRLPGALCPEEDAPLERTAAERVFEHPGVHLFVQPWHRDHDRRPHILEVLRHGIHRLGVVDGHTDRKSTRLNSSHDQISYAVFC